VALCALVWGCTKRETVFVERPIFEQPPAAAAGFLGYDRADSKLTVCGNCHVGQQSQWSGTAHAGAWQTLQGSGHAQGFCADCHTASANGNPVADPSGWTTTQDARYHDVQCESCHGPGLDHVTNPDATQPQASIASVTISGPDTTFVGCAECHSGVHHPFVENWLQSKHAVPNASAAGRAECIGCHTGQGALEAFAPGSEYVERGAPLGQHVGITCAVCHDPHSRQHAGQLRHPIDVPDETRNLCMKCHHKRSEPEESAASLRGPHSPEGPLLLGTAGWWPPGFEPQLGRIVASHGTEGNPRLCATCHVHRYDITDRATGEFIATSTGHRFEAIPCVDANGVPLPVQDCDVSQRLFQSCATSGCHLTPEAALNAFVSARDRIADLVATVDQMLTQVPAGERNGSDGRFTVADGAWFNAELGRLPGTSTHNPFLSEQLLRASINALRDTYGIPVPSGVSLELEL
jgi:hypothetical protein